MPNRRTLRTLIPEARRGLLAAIGPLEPYEAAIFTKRKIIHDPCWGTCEYEPWEATLLELPVFQRLRGLKQTGFAHLTYPAAEHSRFQHTLGVVEAASQVFDSVMRPGYGLSPRGTQLRSKPSLFTASSADKQRWRALVRLAAMVHDLGHSVFSHTSERIFGLQFPFPELALELRREFKEPGAAEVMVYLLVTSLEWRRTVNGLWKRSTRLLAPPSRADWERIGRWVMGQERDPKLKFLGDMISGPVDADKLDYVFRDGYVAGIPVGYDLERLTSTVCVDPQKNKKTGVTWWRLTLPIKGINALEQLVMGRLVLNSYLYHHQKCRAAESAFERALARECLRSKTVLGVKNVWQLFALQDGDVLAFSRGKTAAAREARELLDRQLRVRVLEFRFRDLTDPTERSSVEFNRLLQLGRPKDWKRYRKLVRLEDRIARLARLPAGSVIVDIPKEPSYADLENLLLPGRTASEQESPTKVLNYKDWIDAYKVHRAWVRVFGPRGHAAERRLWIAAVKVLAQKGMHLPESARVHH